MTAVRRRRPAPPEKAPGDDDAETTAIGEGRVEQIVTNEFMGGKAAGHVQCYYVVAKWMILRLLGAVYFAAFLGAWNQNEGLMGSHGLQPADLYMNVLRERFDSPIQGFLQRPTLFWWMELTDMNMRIVTLSGLLLSMLVILGVNSWIIQFLLWLLDFSIVTIAEGTNFYSYGWESQLLETGFLAIFLCQLPHIQGNRIRLAIWESAQEPPSHIVLWLFCWLSFRISLGAGLIKVRGSSCWADKTCLHYHFETQPIPSPLSWLYHFLPKMVQTRMVDIDLWVQLYTSWFVLLPTQLPERIPTLVHRCCGFIVRVGGFVQAGFMVGIILSGNFAFLNHLTIIPALACLDDACWPRSLQQFITDFHPVNHQIGRGTEVLRKMIDILLLSLIVFLSWPVVSNLLQRGGERQLMNASFNSFRLVNTYGAFGSVGKARYEPIISISDDGVQWKELELPCKPGDVRRRPCFCAPYHYRMDWNIWFIGFKPHAAYLQRREKWLYALLAKLLDSSIDTSANGERQWLALLDSSTAAYLRDTYYLVAGSAPRYAKVDMYHYQMAAPLWIILWRSMLGKDVVWWRRKYEESLVLPVEMGSNRKRLQHARLDASTPG